MSLITPIPNGPFYSAPSYYINSDIGYLVIGSGLSVTPDGTLLAASGAGGTVTQVTAGEGLTGGTITLTGTINLKPATTGTLGGIKVGNYLSVAPDGTLNALPPGTGTVTNIAVGAGITGGGAGPSVPIGLQTASATQLGGVIIGSGINVVGGVISLVPTSDVAVGGIQLATAAEVIAGTVANKAVTPATLAAKVASTSASGIVQLSDSVATDSSTLAATSKAVKLANDAAAAAQATADAALPLAGGTLTGVVTFAAGQTFPGVAFPVATALTTGVVRVGAGLSVDGAGLLTTVNNGTVTSVVTGPGLGAPATGNSITTTGTIKLLPPTFDGAQLGGVKKGANIDIAIDGTIRVTDGTFLQLNDQYAFNQYIWPIPLAAPALPCPGTTGQVLTILDNVTAQLGWTNAGMLNQVAAGTGIAVSTANNIATVSLATVPSVVPGTYGGTGLIPTMAVNAYGQITSAGVASVFDPFTNVATTAPSVDLDFTTNNTNWLITLTGNTVINNPVNAQSGQRGSLLITQDPLVARTLTWGAAWKFANGTPYSGNPTLASRDLLEFIVVAGNEIVVTNIVSNLG